jgi:hypothetical protein
VEAEVKTYTVKFKRTVRYNVEASVDANSPEEACDKARAGEELQDEDEVHDCIVEECGYQAEEIE